jgi:hypothetical protein
MVLGALPLRQPKSLGRCDNYAAVFTDQRLILAHVTKQVMNQAVTDARNEAKAQGKGYWGQISGQMATWSTGYSDRFLGMTPTAIIAETPGNIAVRYDAVIEVVVKYIVGGEEDPSEYEVEFVTTMGRFNFKMEDRSVHVSMLSKVFTFKLKTPNGLPRGVTITF